MRKLFKKSAQTQEQPDSPVPQTDADMDAELEAILKQGVADVQKNGKKKWSKKKKIGIGAAAAVVVLFVAFKACSGNGGTMAPLVSTAPLTKGDVVQSLAVTGPISGTDSVDVVSNLHVEITDIAVKEGERVEQDQVIATLDSTDLSKEVEMAKNAYDLAVSTYEEKLRETQNAYEKAIQDYNTAAAAYSRNEQLFAAGSLSQVDLDNSRNLMNDAARQVNSFTVKDGKAVVNDSYALQVENAKFELDQKQTALENTQIKSPISGTVVRVNCKVGRFADKTENDKPMFVIENLDVLEMKLQVSEYSIGKVQVGQQVNITADILGGESAAGEVTAISPTGEEKGGGSTERVVPTTVRITDGNAGLIAGITARAEILLAEAKDVFIADPASLIQKDDGNLYIAALENNTVKMIPVETGVESDFQIAISAKEGYTLEENMTIVTNPSTTFTDGMVVTPIPSM